MKNHKPLCTINDRAIERCNCGFENYVPNELIDKYSEMRKEVLKKRDKRHKENSKLFNEKFKNILQFCDLNDIYYRVDMGLSHYKLEGRNEEFIYFSWLNKFCILRKSDCIDCNEEDVISYICNNW